ncbi:unnamed protein product [Darwinula stevensoni]|uniref:Chitin-binding type-4 domain-containing protein n=1 Tax=Darwinula stevensoni TaxID=69355 RepID=A0A7R9AIP7_9CRUS|nr:unnamed protein product [Darwinula stevensoni]CAG0907088.1 unnamed protein product [Darwinula stevensoni]
MGFFEFRLCPNNNPKRDPSQKCLDKYVLQQADGSGERYYPGPGNGVFTVRYLLPKDVLCSQCVLQWRYVAGNNWGMCRNGTGALGCGPQEEFRACSDVAIEGEGEITHEDEPDEYDNEIGPGESGGSGTETVGDDDRSTVGQTVALVAAFVLTTLLLLAAILYFYLGLGTRAKEFLAAHRPRLSRSGKKKPRPQKWGANGGHITISGPVLNSCTSQHVHVVPAPTRPPRHRSPKKVSPGISLPDETYITVNGVALPD